MTTAEARAALERALLRIAPEVDPGTLDPRASLREQIDLDSMDMLNLLIEIHRTTGVDIPEEDYPKLGSLEECVDYLVARDPTTRERSGA
ncbi:MAG TPA: acyl carrier protein [Gemmatimonadota bacterium]